jgi:hypothetical protein
MRTRITISLALVLLLPALACAQAIRPTAPISIARADTVTLAVPDAVQAVKINPTQGLVNASGTNYVTAAQRLDLLIYRQADNALVDTRDVGKPTPAANGDLSFPLVRGVLSNNTNYYFKVVVIGLAGNSPGSVASNPFAWADVPDPVSNPRAQ